MRLHATQHCKHVNVSTTAARLFIPSIAEQFDSADQSLFLTVLYMHYHVMHRLLPPNKRLQYKTEAS